MTNVSELLLKNGRFYVRYKTKHGTLKLMPRANYVWLKSNPSFKAIPKGYVIHHLDCDETNDDPSNLVLMQKHLHTAYHWKHKRIRTSISILNDNDVVIPQKKPSIVFNKERQKYFLLFVDLSGDEKKRRRIYVDNDGHPFLDKEAAGRYLDVLWGDIKTEGRHIRT